ncbi:ROK family protein [Microbacterium capsulatum]|uniref:ROK family protein n=1 Tax=Microbacterium capsulatum TaxID=3041921 RepID=A0ABU0XCS7_9MICO|nr:ROK family protein [Microbacterium sp. ASV81]MDQ4212509.1 ROK family protein [Microbacterium sp. ASV81]
MSDDAGTRGNGAPVVAGIDIGGTKISAVLTDEAGSVLARGVVPAPAREGGTAMADAAAELVLGLCAEHGVPLAGAGVGAAGVIDQERGVVVAASATFADWSGFPLAAELGDRLGAPVWIENDVNAFLLGELRWGAARGESDVLGIMLGTGVGGAIALDGALHHGAHGAAGEIGHTPGYGDLVCTCGQTGHLETLASGTSIAKRYRSATGSAADAPEIADRARAGEAEAARVFADAARATALAASTAASLVDLDMVVIGGGVHAAWDLLEPAIAETIRTDAPVSGFPLRIVRAEISADAVALGAAALAAARIADPAPTALAPA